MKSSSPHAQRSCVTEGLTSLEGLSTFAGYHLQPHRTSSLKFGFCPPLSGFMPKNIKRRKPDDLPQSHTVDRLVNMVGRGDANVSVAAAVARAAHADGLDSSALKALASCGAGGLFEANTERDLHRWLRGMNGLELEPYELTLDLQVAWSIRSFVCRKFNLFILHCYKNLTNPKSDCVPRWIFLTSRSLWQSVCYFRMKCCTLSCNARVNRLDLSQNQRTKSKGFTGSLKPV